MALGELKRYEYRGILLTASQIAIQSGLSLPTVLRRIRAGITGNDLGAPARTIPLPGNSASFNKSDATPTVPQARNYLRKAQERYDKTGAQLSSAIKRREMPYELDRIRALNTKAEMNVAYWRECVRQAEVRVRVSSPNPINREGRLCPCCGQPLPMRAEEPSLLEAEQPQSYIFETD